MTERSAQMADNNPMLPVPWRISRIKSETRDIFTLDLIPGNDVASYSFQPGQFNMLYAFGTGEAAISISGDPARTDVLTHTIRAVGTVTRALKQLRRGAFIGIRGPYGRPWPVVDAVGDDIVIVAGGIGLAPLRPVIHHLIHNRGQYGRIMILCGMRSPADILFRRELAQWRGRFDIQLEVTVDNVPSGQTWRGDVGVVTKLIAGAVFDPLQTTAMICGPEIMMRFTVRELQQRGLAADHIYLTLERNMKCAVGFCGHCQLGPEFICKDGPVYHFAHIAPWFSRREI